MWEQLAHECERLRNDETVRVVIVRGRGENFSAGADIEALGRTLAADHDGSHYRATNANAERALSELPQVTIAAIDGYCVGGGVQLALACDLRLATPRASFAVTPAHLGIVYPATSIARLVATVGRGVASDLLLRAHFIDAAEALRVGLVSALTDDLDASLKNYCEELVKRSPFTQRASKVVLNHLLESPELMELGRELEAESLTNGDLDEGLAAFREKRQSRFGRPR